MRIATGFNERRDQQRNDPPEPFCMPGNKFHNAKLPERCPAVSINIDIFR